MLASGLTISDASSRARNSRPMTFTRKVALEHLRIDFEKRPPPASNRVMDQRTRDTIQVPDFRDRFGNLDVIGDGADHRMGVRKLSF